jgi:putative transposase
LGVLELRAMPDHLQLFISTSPTESPAGIVKVLKAVTGLNLFKQYPKLKKQYWKGHIWSPSYYGGAAGHVSAEILRNYIESQKGM